jgi:hypothetical protein
MSVVSRWQRLTRLWRLAVKWSSAGPKGLDPAFFAALAPLGLPDSSTDEGRGNRWLTRSATLAYPGFDTGGRIAIGLIVVMLHFAALRCVLLPMGAAG